MIARNVALASLITVLSWNPTMAQDAVRPPKAADVLNREGVGCVVMPSNAQASRLAARIIGRRTGNGG